MSKNRPKIKKEYMKVLRPCIHMHGIQIKSIDAFQELSHALQLIEQTAGIHEVTISFEDIFICPDIEWGNVEVHTPMEKLVLNLMLELMREE